MVQSIPPGRLGKAREGGKGALALAGLDPLKALKEEGDVVRAGEGGEGAAGRPGSGGAAAGPGYCNYPCRGEMRQEPSCGQASGHAGASC